mmetsp:Transcript_16380/g.53422  ORF Transcript_16380/g.53422 Transcript_16380/m.53422 type:complete len:398 (+) Transcript_16380:820-2013(+)
MSVTLTLLALRQLRPNARHVLWPRIDQKSCLKAVSAAGLTPVPIENLLDGDELRTDLDALAAKLSEIGADDVLCVLTTTSCFAPRGVDKLLDVARLCAEQGVPHLCNNAYGVQCDRCMKAIASASRHGRLDCFIQSTDKNFLVPVGGAIVATADGRHGPELLAKVRSTYAGRASISPVLDLFCTLLHLGADGWLRLLERRRASFPDFRRKLEAVAAKHGERVLHTPNNGISMSVTLTPPEGSKPAGSLGVARSSCGADHLLPLVAPPAALSLCQAPPSSCGSCRGCASSRPLPPARRSVASPSSLTARTTRATRARTSLSRAPSASRTATSTSSCAASTRRSPSGRSRRASQRQRRAARTAQRGTGPAPPRTGTSRRISGPTPPPRSLCRPRNPRPA